MSLGLEAHEVDEKVLLNPIDFNIEDDLLPMRHKEVFQIVEGAIDLLGGGGVPRHFKGQAEELDAVFKVKLFAEVSEQL